MMGAGMADPAEAAAPVDPPPPPFNEEAVVFDIVFVMNVNSRGWILEKICRVIDEASGTLNYYVHAERNDQRDNPLPAARHYFFAHFALAHFYMRKYPVVRAGNVFVWYTHPNLGKGMTEQDLVALVRRSTHVFTPCSINREQLVAWGADAASISVPIGGADPALFRPRRRGGGAVGFVGAYYPRKQPHKMLDIARLMPGMRFILLGPEQASVENPELTWENWPLLPEFLALPNVRYVQARYEDYAAVYQQCDVYCSVSELEGGPIPAIEAMMSNVVPVISDTGFARDIVRHGDGGYIFDPAAPAEDIAGLIHLALADVETDIAARTAGWSWTAFGDSIWRAMRGDVVPGLRVPMGDARSAARYLRRGFHTPEERGTFMRSRDAEVDVPLPPGTRAEAVEFFAWAPPAANETVAATFSIDGAVCATAEFGRTPVTVRVPVPEGVAAGGVVQIVIRTERVFDLTALVPGSRVNRKLGLKFGWFRVVAAGQDRGAAPSRKG